MGPYQPGIAPGDEYGIAQHWDASLMTMLPQNKVPGLWLRRPNGRWLEAPAPKGAQLINGGVMLRRWKDDRCLATRVRFLWMRITKM